MWQRIRLQLFLFLSVSLLLVFTKGNEELYRVNMMFFTVFLGWLIMRVFNLKRLDE